MPDTMSRLDGGEYLPWAMAYLRGVRAGLTNESLFVEIGAAFYMTPDEIVGAIEDDAFLLLDAVLALAAFRDDLIATWAAGGKAATHAAHALAHRFEKSPYRALALTGLSCTPRDRSIC